jgi:hypothetical protein
MHVEQRTKENKIDLLHLVGILFIMEGIRLLFADAVCFGLGYVFADAWLRRLP